MLDDRHASVRLHAPARLHLGFLDPSGSLGRRYGSLGLVVDGFETEIELSASISEQVTASGVAERAEVDRAAAYLQLLQRRSGRGEPLQLRLVQVLPAHAGFGSGTQLALAIGRAFAHWHGLNLSTPALAQWLGRGLRSGIGIAGFDHGGLLVDGGPGANGAPASVLSRIPLPPTWRVLVVQDSAHQGLAGAAERRAMATLSPLSQALAADICHQVLMRVLPGAAAADFVPFAAGLNRIQLVLGEHFASAQGGAAFTSAAVGRLIEWISTATLGPDAKAEGPEHGIAHRAMHDAEYVAATGQSSWGPTGFAILPSQGLAEAVVDAARAANLIAPSLTVRIVSGRNAGATVVDERPARRAH
ncbi:MAG TPA: beta-ribofuranosylaminobenzene 5'-phosphate synthase family protein [Polyangia bacterium]